MVCGMENTCLVLHHAAKRRLMDAVNNLTLNDVELVRDRTGA